ncbi:sensor domain-containing diguanylate cyclase [Halomonas sp. NCCP-2165]|nr:sensor domain-containing diguanylate cyclase [Halomonas sp. NCCP-2165]GKW50431.1 diguanylate cyclase [Halomonas sp. NCCP-2165]
MQEPIRGLECPPSDRLDPFATTGVDCRLLAVAIEQSPVATAITDAEGRFEFVNRRFIAVTGYRRDELLGQTPALIKSGHTPLAVYQSLWRTLEAGEVWRGELLNRKKSGELYWEAEIITPVRDEVSGAVRYVVVKEDITQRKRHESELRLLATAFETGQATLITDAEMRIERVNAAFTAITGYRAEEVVGETPRLFKSGRHDDAFYAALWEAVLSTGHWQGEIWNRNKAGEVYPLWQSITAVRDDNGEIRNFVAVFHNISERKRMERELAQQATRDHLTGVLNRRGFDDALAEALAEARCLDRPLSLLIFDIDHFKAVNDRYGHERGDAVLQALARRVQACLRSSDLLARWGGEEFTLLLPGTDVPGARVIAERLRQTVASARFAGLEVTISLGGSRYRRGDSGAALLQRADAALYRAKEGGRNRVVMDGQGDRFSVEF